VLSVQFGAQHFTWVSFFVSVFLKMISSSTAIAVPLLRWRRLISLSLFDYLHSCEFLALFFLKHCGDLAD